MDAPSRSAGEKTPPKNPKLRQITVTNNLRIKIRIRNDKENESFKIFSIVSPPSPKISGMKPPRIPQIEAAIKILKSSFFDTLVLYFCRNNRLFIKITAMTAQIGPKNKDMVTEGNSAIFEFVLWKSIPKGKK